jgi:hypothetical protein
MKSIVKGNNPSGLLFNNSTYTTYQRPLVLLLYTISFMQSHFTLYCILLFTIACSEQKPAAETFKLNPFPGATYQKVVAYKMNGDNKKVVNADLQLSEAVVSKGVVLTKEQENQWLAIYQSKDSYGDDSYRCFEAAVGFVVYDSLERVVAHSTVSFSCNWMQNIPDIGAAIFSVKGAMSLAELEKDIFGLL